MVTVQNPTYFTTEGIDYGVLALTLRQLATVSAALDFALDRDPTVGAEALDIRNVVLEAIQHLKGRESDEISLPLLRFVQKMAAQEEGGIITAQYREEAKALLQRLAEVEVRNDDDR